MKGIKIISVDDFLERMNNHNRSPPHVFSYTLYKGEIKGNKESDYPLTIRDFNTKFLRASSIKDNPTTRRKFEYVDFLKWSFYATPGFYDRELKKLENKK